MTRASPKRLKNSPKVRSSMSGSGSAASAISRGKASSSVSILPSFLADQRDEADGAQILLLENAIVLLGHLDQLLNAAGLAHRHDDAAVRRELLDQRARHVAPARRRQDGIERRVVAATFGSIRLDDLDIVVAEAPKPLARDLYQLMLALDADHQAGNAADDGRG